MDILLADDHFLVRDAIAALLMQADAAIRITSCDDHEGVIAALSSNRSFDIVITDLRMPGMEGMIGLQRILNRAGDTPVLLMSGTASSGDVRAAMDLGLRGFVPKTLAGRSLINAVRLVAGGDTYLPADMMMRRDAPASGATVARLSPREEEVLRQLKQGSSNKEIARLLNVAETTVKLHLRSLSAKLLARNRTDIVMRAIESGII